MLAQAGCAGVSYRNIDQLEKAHTMETTLDKSREILNTRTWGSNRMAASVRLATEFTGHLPPEHRAARMVTSEMVWVAARLLPAMDTRGMTCDKLVDKLAPMIVGGCLDMVHLAPEASSCLVPGLGMLGALQAAATARGHVKDTVRWLSELEDAFAGSADEMPSAGRALMQFWASYWTGRPPSELVKAFPKLLGDVQENAQLKQLLDNLLAFLRRRRPVGYTKFGASHLDSVPSDKFGRWFSFHVSNLFRASCMRYGAPLDMGRLKAPGGRVRKTKAKAERGKAVTEHVDAASPAAHRSYERPRGLPGISEHWAMFAAASTIGLAASTRAMPPGAITGTAATMADELVKSMKVRT
jgi:hypothetical protein